MEVTRATVRKSPVSTLASESASSFRTGWPTPTAVVVTDIAEIINAFAGRRIRPRMLWKLFARFQREQVLRDRARFMHVNQAGLDRLVRSREIRGSENDVEQRKEGCEVLVSMLNGERMMNAMIAWVGQNLSERSE